MATSDERLALFKQEYPIHDDVVMTTADFGVVVAYFIIIIAIGVVAMCCSNRSTIGGFFLAGRSMVFFPIGASLFVSNIGTEHFIGLSGSGAASGIGVGAWEFNAILLLQLLGWVFIPVYIACGTYTMPEYLTKRFGGERLRVYFAVLSLILYIFTKCSGDLFTGALFIQQSLRWNLYLCILVLVVITGILTMTGGLTAVIYTDTMQCALMVGGGLWLMVESFKRIGGYDGLVRKYPNATTKAVYRLPNETCHETDKYSFQMLRGVDDDYMPWLGFLLGQTPGSIWYWCADQVIVQRLLAAKSLSHAQGATLMAGFIKVLPLFMMVMPGMISRILYADEVACVDPEICNYVCQSEAGCSSIAYPRLVLGVMPEGLRGLMMAVMIAALMSDLDSIFNSASTLFTVDIYTKIRKSCSQREQMVVGRLFILVMVGVSIAWVPVLKETQGGQVFIYIQEITNYLAPPFAAIFLLAVLVPRVNEKGAFWGLMLAFVTGVTRMILSFVYYDAGGCGKEDKRPIILKNFHYMYFSLFITLLTAATAIIVSLCTEKPEPKYLTRTTFWTRKAPLIPNEDSAIEPSEKETDHNGFTNLAMVGDTNMQVFSVEDKKVFRDPNIDRKPARKRDVKESCGNRALNFVCGLTTEVDEQKERQLKIHMEKVASLKQNKYAKVGLNIGLVIILCLGAFLYFFFSFWKYEPK
ncbi:sodium/myo-inositol cotransporter-like isoform X1 [Mya arenaria]|uniref:sodium/myo-inositol cotransporter-like isoform X1 n=1 Tax=Mya arenaria TaxID=6604 RepID=UPI0022E77AD3|nr:sodium/myo-inositol cotransporter-like isoform X1 [Mya arenaria]